MSTEMFITAVGEDRPGVVAALTGALVELDVNLEDTSMTVLGGRFAMVLLVVAPDDLSTDVVQAALSAPASDLHLDVTVHPSDPSGTVDPAGVRWNVSVYGSDHPGIVHGVASALADLDANIVDLTTRVVGPPESAVYAMLLDVVGPPSIDEEQLGGVLAEVADRLGIEVSLHAADADIL